MFSLSHLPGGIFFLIHGRRSRHSTDRSEASRKLRLKSQAPKTTVQKWLSTRKHGTFRLLPFHQASASPYRWHNQVRFGNCSLGARFWHLSAVLQLIAYLFTKKDCKKFLAASKVDISFRPYSFEKASAEP